jgi:hypothetical protein
MIILLRAHLSDEQAVGWPTDFELLAYLDRAADYLSDQLIVSKDPVMMKEIYAQEGTNPLPPDFVSLVGNVPVSIVGRDCHVDVAMPVRYWSKFPSPSAFGEEEPLPYTREHELLITDIAVMFALNKNEYDVSQDMAIFAETTKGIAAARKR